MYRYEKLVEKLNMYEKSLKTNYTVEAEIDKNELLSSLSKSKKYKEIYEEIKQKNYKMNRLLVPYRVFRDNDGMMIYKVKTFEEFKEDYSNAFYIIESLYKKKDIDYAKCYSFRKTVENMYDSFYKEFKETELDKLSLNDKVKYEIDIINIRKKYDEYISVFGSEAFYLKIKEYEKLSSMGKRNFLIKQNNILKDIIGIKDIDILFVDGALCDINDLHENHYSMAVGDVGYYSLDLLVLEQIYKIECMKLRNSGENENILKALLEDVSFKKSNYKKAEEPTRSKKKK